MGVIGGNGTGKTSLLRLIAGEAEPDGGVIKLGDTVKASRVVLQPGCMRLQPWTHRAAAVARGHRQGGLPLLPTPEP
jgi:ATPase subunit of ABC transporter with duplicated ATPase domains